MSSLPASILLKSRMSFRIVNNESADVLTVCKYSRCSALNSVSRANSVMPRMPFMGVRIHHSRGAAQPAVDEHLEEDVNDHDQDEGERGEDADHRERHGALGGADVAGGHGDDDGAVDLAGAPAEARRFAVALHELGR